MITQEEINNTVVDVVYDDNQIYHVLEPNMEGIRGIPPSQFMIRNTILEVRRVLSGIDQTRIDKYEQELIRNYDEKI